jgi:hypothetical protein
MTKPLDFEKEVLLSMSALGREFGLHRQTVSARLREVRPARIEGNTQLYRLRDAWPAIIGTRQEPGEINPEKLTPKERRDWYEGEKVRRALEVDAGKLLRADEAEIEFAAMVKTFAGALEILPFRLERECSLSGETVERLQIAIDEARENLYRAMVGRGAGADE